MIIDLTKGYLQASLVQDAVVRPDRTAASILNIMAATWLHVSPSLKIDNIKKF